MSSLSRALITFANFVFNYYIIVKLTQGVSDPTELQGEMLISTIVMLTMIGISIKEWDISYFFGGMAVLYCPFIAMRSGFSLLTAAVFGATGGALLAINNFRFPSLPDWLSPRSLGSSIGGTLGRSRAISRIRVSAGVKDGGADLGDREVQEFLSLERELARITAFFNGTDPALEKALADAVPQIQSLQKDHARLLLRTSHLNSVLGKIDTTGIKKELLDLTGDAEAALDPIVKGQLQETVGMKKRRLEEIEKLETCRQRIKAQRLQILETVKGTFEKINSLKYADIQVLETSTNAISADIRQVRNSLDDLETGLLEMESLGRPR